MAMRKRQAEGNGPTSIGACSIPADHLSLLLTTMCCTALSFYMVGAILVDASMCQSLKQGKQ